MKNIKSGVLTECLSSGEISGINTTTRYKVLALCRNGARRDVLSPSELKEIERFLGVNARQKAAHGVPQ